MRCFCWEEGRLQFNGWYLEAALKKNIKMTRNSLKRRTKGQRQSEPRCWPRRREADRRAQPENQPAGSQQTQGSDTSQQRSQGFYSQKRFRRAKRARGGGEVTPGACTQEMGRDWSAHAVLLMSSCRWWWSNVQTSGRKCVFCSCGLKKKKRKIPGFRKRYWSALVE